MYIKSSEKTTVSLWKFEAEWLSNQGAWWTCNPKAPSSSLTSWLNSGYTVSEIAPKSLFSGCSLGTGHQSILCLLCRILGLTFHSLRPYFYSDMEPLSAPFSATKIFNENPVFWAMIWVSTMTGLLKQPLSICQSRWNEIGKAFSVIHWVL